MSWKGEIVGHRGAAGLAPENTLVSFERAISEGVDAIEFDVKLSSDGKVVIFHDNDLSRFLAGEEGVRPVSARTLAELTATDVGAALGAESAFIPSLEEGVSALAGRVRLIPEVKDGGEAGIETARKVVTVLEAEDLIDDSVLSSKHVDVVTAAGAFGASVRTALIAGGSFEGDALAAAVDSGCTALHARKDRVNPDLLEHCARLGLTLRVWTLNEEAELRQFMDMGVDGIVTDRPDRLRSLAAR